MKRNNINIVLIITLSVFLSSLTAQTCGFGCLGLSGIYGGYSFQNYEAENINEYLKNKNASNISTPELGIGNGFRIGANLFRAKFDNLFLSAKGFYQFVDENYQIETNLVTLDKEKYEFNSNYFGFGLDFGINLVDVLSLKLIEGGVTFHDAELKITENYVNNTTQDETYKFSNDKLNIGYYIGTGLILHLIEDYVSIEGTAFYSFYSIDNISTETASNEIVYLLPDDKKTINSGGFGASVQLNVGFPF